MLILGMAGSPRRGGNSEVLLDEALKAAKEAGAEVKKLVLPRLKLSPCIACGDCEKTGKCAVKDEMQDVYRLIDEAGAIILASPIYFYNVTAWAKAMIDRAQAPWSKRYILKEKVVADKKGVFIGVGATRGDRLFEGTCLTVQYFYDAMGIDYTGDLLVRGVDGKGEIHNHPEHIRAAAEMGRMLAGS